MWPSIPGASAQKLQTDTGFAGSRTARRQVVDPAERTAQTPLGYTLFYMFKQHLIVSIDRRSLG